MPASDHRNASIVWFRRDLRLDDNKALQAAVQAGGPVICVYIRQAGDPHAGALGAAQAWWLHHSLQALGKSLVERGNSLILATGEPLAILSGLAKSHGADRVYWNRRFSPAGIETDKQVKAGLSAAGIEAKSFSGALLHDPLTLMNNSGQPYRVYTPFWKAIDAKGDPDHPFDGPARIPAPETLPASEELSSWGLLPVKPDWAAGFAEHWQPGEAGARKRLTDFIENALAGYKVRRDQPGTVTTSMLSPHLALGEIAPSRIWHSTIGLESAIDSADIIHFRKELVWRDFSWNLLFHNPDLAEANLQRRFDRFPWVADAGLLTAWQKGKTGYPIVDAGMRQLWTTGWMHNRVRMIVGSFLIKDLMIDWRAGERWFRDTLVDADEASNAASWQWVAGSGADAAPFFRIFNPVRQGETFDPDGTYVRRHVPELAGLPAAVIHKPFEADLVSLAAGSVRLGKTYPLPVVSHSTARDRALSAFQSLKDAS